MKGRNRPPHNRLQGRQRLPSGVSTGSGSDRVSTHTTVDITQGSDRSLPLPVLTLLHLIPVASRSVQHVMSRDDAGDPAVLFNQTGWTCTQFPRHHVYVVVDVHGGKAFVHKFPDGCYQHVGTVKALERQFVLPVCSAKIP